MYNRFVLIVVFVPLAIILIALAVANRELVAFTLDPFNPGNPALTLNAAAVRLPVPGACRRHGRRQRCDLGQAGPLPQAGAPARARRSQGLRDAAIAQRAA